MVNALKLMEKTNHQYASTNSNELGIEYTLFKDIAARCGFEVRERLKNSRRMFKLKKCGIPLIKLYSREEDNKFNFLDIADLHVGSSNFNEDKLNSLLTMAVERNVKQVFIAGDIFEAVYEPAEYDFRILNQKKIRQIEKSFKNQLYTIYKILKQYDLNYYAINGNHEYCFEQLGVYSPLKILEEKLRAIGINFNAYDTYIMDFLVAGVIKRMIHLESYYERKNISHALERLYEFERHGGLKVQASDGVDVPIRFLECGHIHLTMELYSSVHNVYVTQPGSLIVNENPYEPGIFVRGEITPENNVIRY